MKIKNNKILHRISIFKSNKEIYVQIIDDIERKTITSYSSLKIDKYKNKKITKIDKSKIVGLGIAKKMKKHNIKKAYYDNKGGKYHGRIKVLIENIRSGGIKI
ncbi:MAG: 50S ribosomal protein L18 [Candidatus Shikimatogenerans bostrichidophilus]|nr:MAG: 50S ribosomal protein L18 [Candidatus Shikimatogenerans bostrichidophilus]